MPATATRPFAKRTAKVRSRATEARPRITYAAIARVARYSHGYVRNVLSDNTYGQDVSEALTRIERAVLALEADRNAAPLSLSPSGERAADNA